MTEIKDNENIQILKSTNPTLIKDIELFSKLIDTQEYNGIIYNLYEVKTT